MTFQKGHGGFRLPASYEISRGKPTWNKGTKGIMKSNQTSFQKGSTPWNKGIENPYSDEWIRAARTRNVGKKYEKFTGEKHKKRMVGNKNNWKGGRYLDNHGYVMLYVGDGNYRAEHRMRAEKALGRPLKRCECVHHINGDTSDNRNCNLIICDSAYHLWLERRMSNLYKQEHFSPAPETMA